MSEITLVTAYFNIGRESWAGYSRSNDKYIYYFKHWARIKNKLIVYTTPDIADKIKEIRHQFGLDDRTIVISIQDVTTIAPDLYGAIKSVMTNKESWLFHKKLDHPESWNYLYNYVTGIKPFWVQDAIQRGLADGMVAWIDFGYDHGGEDFPNSEDFDFLWQYQFPPFIHIFLAKELDETPIFKIVQTMDTYIRGGIILAPDFLWKQLWKDSYSATKVLSECGLADDDQTITLLAYRRHPENFKTHMTSYWGEALRSYGGEQLRLRQQKRKKPHALLRKLKKYLQQKRINFDIKRRHGTEIEKKYFSVHYTTEK